MTFQRWRVCFASKEIAYWRQVLRGYEREREREREKERGREKDYGCEAQRVLCREKAFTPPPPQGDCGRDKAQERLNKIWKKDFALRATVTAEPIKAISPCLPKKVYPQSKPQAWVCA